MKNYKVFNDVNVLMKKILTKDQREINGIYIVDINVVMQKEELC